MADYHWVAIAGNLNGTWSTTNLLNWSSTAGGAGGSYLTPPTASDSVFFDQAGTYTVTLTGALTCLDFNISAGSVTFTSTGTLAISGSMNISATPTVTWNATGTITWNASSAKTVKSSGVQFSCSMTFNNALGSWQLDGALSLNPSTVRTITLTAGSLLLNNYTFTGGQFSSSNTNTRNINFGSSGAINLTGVGTITIWSMADATGFTSTATGAGLKPVVLTATTPVAGTTRSIGFGSTANAVETNVLDFTIKGGSDTISLTGSGTGVRALDFYAGGTSTFAGTYNPAAVNQYYYGDFTFNASAVFGANGFFMHFVGTASRNIDSKGIAFGAMSMRFESGTWTFLGNASTTNDLQLSGGTLNLNGKTVSLGSGVVVGGAGAKVLTLGGGTLSLAAVGATAFNTSGSSNFTMNAGDTGVISMTGATAKSFLGGGYNYYATLNNGGAGALTVTGSNTFNDITATSLPSTITLTAGTTQTVRALTLSGTAGNLVTLNSSSAGSAATLSKSGGGIVTVKYVSIKDSTATGAGASWYAPTTQGNVNVSGNSGWIFNITPLLPTRVANVNTFYNPALLVSIALRPTRYTNPNTFYSPVLTARVSLSPTLIPSSNAFYAARINTSITLRSAKYTNTSTLYPPSILIGAVALRPTLLANANVFYHPTVVPGAVTIYPTAISSTSVVYSPFLHVYTNLKPPLLVSTTVFYPANLIGGSPVPIPWHPHCQHEGMTVTEAPRSPMTVVEFARKSMSPGC